MFKQYFLQFCTTSKKNVDSKINRRTLLYKLCSSPASFGFVDVFLPSIVVSTIFLVKGSFINDVTYLYFMTPPPLIVTPFSNRFLTLFSQNPWYHLPSKVIYGRPLSWIVYSRLFIHQWRHFFQSTKSVIQLLTCYCQKCTTLGITHLHCFRLIFRMYVIKSCCKSWFIYSSPMSSLLMTSSESSSSTPIMNSSMITLAINSWRVQTSSQLSMISSFRSCQNKIRLLPY